MPFQFVSQPFRPGLSLGDYFREVLEQDVRELDIVSAWVKRSGVAAIEHALHELSSRGVWLRAVVGISLGGTTRQGLEALLANVNELFIYQHPGRTFHPKIYRASGGASALTLVGSHNLTAGGVANNFEAATLGRSDLESEPERAYHEEVREFIDLLVDDAPGRRVDLAFIDELVISDRYLLPDESSRLATGDETGTRANPEDPNLFKKSDHPLRRFLPPRPVDDAPVTGPADDSPNDTNDPSAAAPKVDLDSSDAEPTVVRRWFKSLRAIDAQQGTSANWNPSNTATLVQAGHPIRRETYFRDIFFGDLEWITSKSRGGKSREIAKLKAEVTANDQALGEFEFEIRHTPEYDSDQENRTTELQWGDLSAHMRAVNHVGDYLTLERLSDGTTRLHLAAEPTGPFKK